MFLSHHDVAHRAAQVARGLTDAERTALGIHLIRMDGAEAPFVHVETPAAAITHEHIGSRASGPAGKGRTRRAWARFQEAERRFSEGRGGDIVGGICVVLLGVGLVIVGGVLQ